MDADEVIKSLKVSRGQHQWGESVLASAAGKNLGRWYQVFFFLQRSEVNQKQRMQLNYESEWFIWIVKNSDWTLNILLCCPDYEKLQKNSTLSWTHSVYKISVHHIREDVARFIHRKAQKKKKINLFPSRMYISYISVWIIERVIKENIPWSLKRNGYSSTDFVSLYTQNL